MPYYVVVNYYNHNVRHFPRRVASLILCRMEIVRTVILVLILGVMFSNVFLLGHVNENDGSTYEERAVLARHLVCGHVTCMRSELAVILIHSVSAMKPRVDAVTYRRDHEIIVGRARRHYDAITRPVAASAANAREQVSVIPGTINACASDITWFIRSNADALM